MQQPPKGYRVYNLLDSEDRWRAQAHVGAEIERLDAEINRVQKDLHMVRETDQALAKVQTLLAQMRALAEQATKKNADRAALSRRFAALRAEISGIADGQLARWSPQEAARLRTLLGELHL